MIILAFPGFLKYEKTGNRKIHAKKSDYFTRPEEVASVKQSLMVCKSEKVSYKASFPGSSDFSLKLNIARFIKSRQVGELNAFSRLRA